MVERAWSIAGRQQLGNQQRKIRRKKERERGVPEGQIQA